MSNKFTWVKTYKEIADKLCAYENRQEELIAILKDIGITRFNDYDINGACELNEIDPFTFFSYLNKYKNDRNRISYLKKLHSRLQLTSKPPSDVEGLPTCHPMKVWLFGYKVDRNPDDIPLLWALFKQTIGHTIENDTLQKVLRIRGVGKGKLSICWFYSDPEYFLPLDSQTSRYLRENQLRYTYYYIEEYNDINKSAKDFFQKAPFEISADAWTNHLSDNTKKKRDKKIRESKVHVYDINKLINLEFVPPHDVIDSVSDFLRLIFDESEMASNDCSFFYRGHASTSWTLKPGIYRDESLTTKEHILFKEMESAVPAEFSTCKCTFDRLVKMQHYEYPTRLLDITSNPLVALYFACVDEKLKEDDGMVYLFKKYEGSELTKYSDSDAVSVVANIARRDEDFEINTIRGLEKESFNESDQIDYLLHEIKSCDKAHFRPLINYEDIERVFFVKPKMDNPRIVKQEGAFFLFGIKNHKLKCPELKDFFDSIDFFIPKESKERILVQLNQMGINEASLFPEIDHVAKFLKKKYGSTT